MIHTRLQLDPHVDISTRKAGTSYEILVLDVTGEASLVIEMDLDTLGDLYEALTQRLK